jgi:hydrogenase expression/formation protein HypC
MCLAVPMQLVEITTPETGTAELSGARYTVNLSLVDDAKVGEYLIVHAGFAIEKLDEEEASARLALFAEMAAAYEDDATTGDESEIER